MSSYPPPPPSGPISSSPYAPLPTPGWDLGACVSWAWAKFQQNLGMIAGALILLVGIAIVEAVGFAITSSLTTTSRYVCDANFNCHFTGGTPWIVATLLNLVVGVAIAIVAQILSAGLIRGALGVTEGRPFQVGDLFNLTKVGPILVTAVLVGAITFVGTILCFLPGIVASYMLSYSLYFVIDKDMAPMDAVKASFELTRNNLGSTIVWYLVGGLIAVAGFLACCVGVLATIPITLLGTAYTYKKLTGAEVVA